MHTVVKFQTLISWSHFAKFGTESKSFAKCVLHVVTYIPCVVSLEAMGFGCFICVLKLFIVAVS